MPEEWIRLITSHKRMIMDITQYIFDGDHFGIKCCPNTIGSSSLSVGLIALTGGMRANITRIISVNKFIFLTIVFSMLFVKTLL